MNLPDCHITQRVRETHVLSLKRRGTVVGFAPIKPGGHMLPIVLIDGVQTGQSVHQAHLTPIERNPSLQSTPPVVLR